MSKLAQSKVTSKGQVTVPEAIRRALHLQEGDVLQWRTDERGQVAVRKVTGDLRDLAGILHRPGSRRVTIEAMDESIAEHVRARFGDHRRR
jgi:AbrB family looped-hinge helix DNA binding protein